MLTVSRLKERAGACLRVWSCIDNVRTMLYIQCAYK